MRSKTQKLLKNEMAFLFQSTCSVRSKTALWTFTMNRKQFQSTCSVRSKTKWQQRSMICCLISIHLLRAEQDDFIHLCLRLSRHFNPLAPCGARREYRVKYAANQGISIHLLRAEQDLYASAFEFTGAISIHLLRAEQDANAGEYGAIVKISIHLLRAEQDVHRANRRRFAADFNPLAPCGARLHPMCGTPYIVAISIHLLRAEQDHFRHVTAKRNAYFNPLAPCGARRRTIALKYSK